MEHLLELNFYLKNNNQYNIIKYKITETINEKGNLAILLVYIFPTVLNIFKT